jgi:anaphase-promoting complex subunit 2
MLKVQGSVAGQMSAGTFASVFSAANVKPPKHKQRFTPAAAQTVPDIRRALIPELRKLLGIGGSGLVYGQVQTDHENGQAYCSNFAACLSMHEVRQPTTADHEAQTAKQAKSSLWPYLPRWASTVGPDTMKKVLAHVLDDLMTEFVTWAYSGVYQEGVQLHLHFWVEHIFSTTVKALLAHLQRDSRAYLNRDSDLKNWKETATARLGALRVEELFDVVVDWDMTAPAIEDLRHFTTNPVTRSYLTHNFANTLQARLLHPGASTIEILQLYISVIRSFRILDPKGVLLDRVARKVRRYLRERDDTVRVIVAGLLADITVEEGEDPQHDPDTLSELAIELSKSTSQARTVDDSEFDWNNMDWLPDPVDAAPDYMKSKNTDVIGSLITLFDSKDIFVKELQTILAERLLKHKPDFNQEIGVVEHLKIRFGDAALQGCEVMLRDVLDSRKVDNVVRKDVGMQDDKGQPLQDLQLHAKILSRLFWPSVPEQSFNVPQVVLEQQQNYEKGFEALKQSRKLTWINAIGQVEVELELEDRIYQDEVLPWQAAVIYAFQEESDDQIIKSITDIASELEMSPTLVRSACIFWVSKHILTEISKDTFTVLERLRDGDDIAMDEESARPDAAAAAAADVAAAQAGKEAEEAERKQKMAMYHQFIISMLTNQGAMPLPRIAMMLGIVVPGGFPFSNEELKEFLAGMIKDGALEVGHGGSYKALG